MNNNVQKLQTMMIYHDLYSLNQYRNEHYYKLNSIKKGWSNTVELACIWNKIQSVDKCILKFTFIFKDRRKRDIDNYSATVKMIIDGLVSYGILPDDNWNHVVKIEMAIAIQAKTEGVQVTIEEV
jgi:Holliday junction resolvase RusA-like endonuclease